MPDIEMSENANINNGAVTLTVIADTQRRFNAEFPPASTIREILSGFMSTDDIKAIQIGGPVYPFLSRDALDKSLNEAAVSGSEDLWLPVMRIVRESSKMPELTADLMSFLSGESCGKCVFCREGIIHLRNMLDTLVAGRGAESDIDLMVEIGQMMRKNSICAFGRAAAEPVLSSIALFRDEFESMVGRGASSAAPDTEAAGMPDTAARRERPEAQRTAAWREAFDSIAAGWRIALEDTITAGIDKARAPLALMPRSPNTALTARENSPEVLTAFQEASETPPTAKQETPDAPIKITIDGREVETEQGKTILEVCLDAGVYIPHLCRHNALQHLSACRLCVVEAEGVRGLLPSCAAAALDGMIIHTQSDEIDKTRRMSIELMLSGHQADCGTCIKYLNCELQSLKQFLIGDELRVARRSRLFGISETDPIFSREPNKCVLCGRCVRACRELRGVGVLEYKHSHGEIYIGIGPDPGRDIPLAEAGCRFCGACAEVCPTGAILDRDEFGQNKLRKEALLPCVNTCPAEIDIPRYIRYIREGRTAEAVAVIREKVPFPKVLGYVCSRPCEEACRRGQVNVNEPMAICHLKRYAAENVAEASLPQNGTEKATAEDCMESARAEDDTKRSRAKDCTESAKSQNVRKKPETGKRAAVIGAGPAGLTAAYYLTMLGHSATVFEEAPLPGGMLRYGIPAYKLPRGALDSEITDIAEAGVTIITNTKIESVDQLFTDGFDAVLIAIGAQKGVLLRIPGAKGGGVFTGTEFLRASHTDEPILPGGRLMVLGGGNVAFDCARTALRLGAQEGTRDAAHDNAQEVTRDGTREVTLACLESRETMPASPDEIEAAEEEGVRILPSRSFKRIQREDGRVTGVVLQNVTSLSVGDEGALIVETQEDSEHIIEADAIIFAVGQAPDIPEDFGVETTEKGFIDASRSNMAVADREGVFAASDAVTGTDKVISAIAAGRKAALAMDKYLGGRGRFDAKAATEPEPPAWLGSIDGFSCQQRVSVKHEPPEERIRDFRLVECSLEKADAEYEAGRCLQCDMRLNMKPEKFWSSY